MYFKDIKHNSNKISSDPLSEKVHVRQTAWAKGQLYVSKVPVKATTPYQTFLNAAAPPAMTHKGHVVANQTELICVLLQKNA